MTLLGSSPYGYNRRAQNDELTTVVLGEGYEEGDVALFLWQIWDGRPSGARCRRSSASRWPSGQPGQKVPLNGIRAAYPVAPDGDPDACTLFDDRGGLAYFTLGRAG